MICYICKREIVGAYLTESDDKKRCRHIECKRRVFYASSELKIKPKGVKSYRTDLVVDDPDSIISENIIGDINEQIEGSTF